MHVNATKLLAIALGLLVLSGQAAAVRIVAGPYLQEPAETSMTVMWITDEECTSWVEYGQGRSLDEEAYRSRHGLIDACQTVHKVKIRGLSPGTQYRYRVRSTAILEFDPDEVTFGDTVSSDTFAFTTLSGNAESISFVVMNDIHEKNEILTSLVRRAADRAYDLVFLNGDILEHVEDQQQIIDHVLAPCTELFASQTPFIYVRGNHDTRGRFARMLPDYIGMPDDRYYYAFTHGPVRIIVLDGGENNEDTAEIYAGLVDFDRYRDAQRQWLMQEIWSDAFRSAPFRVVVVHMPPGASGHGPNDMHRKWTSLLNEGKLDLMICGHKHRYEIVEPKEGVRDYPMVIGGGPTPGAATLIRVDATTTALDVTMTTDDGDVVGACSITR
ncbi:MAG: purple acid phosphatase family protein [Planctomycetota bacterium]|jgi:predicted phosphodiesterase